MLAPPRKHPPFAVSPSFTRLRYAARTLAITHAFSKIGVMESVSPLARVLEVANASAQIRLPLVAPMMK